MEELPAKKPRTEAQKRTAIKREEKRMAELFSGIEEILAEGRFERTGGGVFFVGADGVIDCAVGQHAHSGQLCLSGKCGYLRKQITGGGIGERGFHAVRQAQHRRCGRLRFRCGGFGRRGYGGDGRSGGIRPE